MSESSTSGQGADRGWANSRAAATGEAGGWAWVVSGHNGEDLIRAEGPMAAVAWQRAAVRARRPRSRVTRRGAPRWPLDPGPPPRPGSMMIRHISWSEIVMQ
ncbi:MAG TPA: hypothetical protein VKP69_28905, partial [Isosphaeraceae bacterium]|nr:hypothetical protein [Isosphaeraceae bacterium]